MYSPKRFCFNSDQLWGWKLFLIILSWTRYIAFFDIRWEKTLILIVNSFKLQKNWQIQRNWTSNLILKNIAYIWPSPKVWRIVFLWRRWFFVLSRISLLFFINVKISYRKEGLNLKTFRTGSQCQVVEEPSSGGLGQICSQKQQNSW